MKNESFEIWIIVLFDVRDIRFILNRFIWSLANLNVNQFISSAAMTQKKPCLRNVYKIILILQDEIKFLLANTKYNREEIIRWHAGFLKDCKSGLLDKKQFIDVFKEFYPEGKAEKYCAQIFNVFDADHSGKIDFVEFLAALSSSTHGDAQQKLRMGFNLVSADFMKAIKIKHFVIFIFSKV